MSTAQLQPNGMRRSLKKQISENVLVILVLRSQGVGVLVQGFNSTLDAMARGVQTSEEAKTVEVLYDELDPQQMQANAPQLSIRVRYGGFVGSKKLSYQQRIIKEYNMKIDTLIDCLYIISIRQTSLCPMYHIYIYMTYSLSIVFL